MGRLVGIYNYPPLLDGGRLFRLEWRFTGCMGNGKWRSRIAPDIEVENDPASVAAGHDRQLEKAVQVTLEALKKNPVVIPDHPAYPNYHKN